MEEWVDIKGYEGYYQIHQTQGVRSLDRWVGTNGGGKIFLNGKTVAQSLNSEGYLKVGLSKNGRLKNRNIHILLAETFIPNPQSHKLVRHLNDVKTDNRLTNLAWGTDQDNADDKKRNGWRPPKGETHWNYGRKRGQPVNFGRKGANANNNKIIVDLMSGIFYYGTQDAAEAKGINPNTLRCKLSGHYKNDTGLMYV